MNRNVYIVIPAYNPGKELSEYVLQLINKGFDRILLVDDGSRQECKEIFHVLAEKTECTVFTHAVNMGKGRALKDAFNYILASGFPGGVITVDSDGQHRAEDVLRIYQEMQNYPDSLVLGGRDFDNPTVPFKSRFGNKLTRIVLKLLIGGNISDTQTGMRGIPNILLGRWSVLFGERFEYETMMLIDGIKSGTSMREVKIETIYIDDNRETHFNAITDSLAIYRLIFMTFFRYILISLLSFVIDYSLFCLFIGTQAYGYDRRKIVMATVAARVCSSLFNYAANKRVVFKSGNGRRQLPYYYVLCAIQMACSALLVTMLGMVLPVQVAKILVDTVLFFMSFQIQQRIIFRNGGENGGHI